MSEINPENFPSNSHNKNKKEITPITTAEVITRKPTMLKKIRDAFIGEDVESIGDYILFDVLIPSAKDTIVDAFTNAIEIFFGVNNRKAKSMSNSIHTAYSYISTNKANNNRNDRQFDERKRKFDGQDIIVASRGEAEAILEDLDALCRQYNSASVADLYSLVNVTADFTAEKWGWESIRGAKVIRQRGGGYLISLPKPIYLE